jgi:hypothetical protein
MQVRTGDRVIVESERLARPPRTGLIEEVNSRMPTRYRVRWDDGRTSVITPSSGALHIDRSETERADTADLFRVLNDRIRDIEQRRVGEHPFVCECGDETCTRAMRMTDLEYTALRSDSRTFAVFPGHEDEAETEILIRSDRYVVVRREEVPPPSTPRPSAPERVAETASTEEARTSGPQRQRLLERVPAWKRSHHRPTKVDSS